MLVEIVQLRNTIHLRSQFWVNGRVLNYADQNGQVTDLLLDHYAEMASSGVAMVVEKTAVHLSGLKGRMRFPVLLSEAVESGLGQDILGVSLFSYRVRPRWV